MKLLSIKLEINHKSVEITRWGGLLMVLAIGKTVGLKYEGSTRTALKVFKALDYNPQLEELGVMECVVNDVWLDTDLSEE